MLRRLALASIFLFASTGCDACSAGDDGAPWQLEERTDAGATADATEAPDLGPYEPDTTDECDNVPAEATFSQEGGDVVQVRIARGPDGCPHIGFFETNAIKYARWDGETWKVEPMVAAGRNNWEFDIDVDADGRPHVVYQTGSGDVVRYAYRSSDGEWTSTIVDEFFMWEVNHQIAPDGRPSFLAVRTSQRTVGSDARVLYYEWSGDGWTSNQVIDAQNALYVSDGLEYDSNGHPVIAVAGGSSLDTLFVSRRNADGLWQTQTVSTEQSAARSAMLAIDGSGRVLVPYCGFADPPGLSLLTSTDAGLATESAIELRGGCLPAGAIVDNSGRLHVLINKLHAIYSDGQWQQYRLDELGHEGPQYISTAFDLERGIIHVLTVEDSDEPRNRKAVYRRLPLDPSQ